mgnify:CR=1 FL=1
MSDIYTERDPVKVFNPKPNTHGKSPEYLEALQKTETAYKDYLKVIDEFEEKALSMSNKEKDELWKVAADKYAIFEETERNKDAIYDRDNKPKGRNL